MTSFWNWPKCSCLYPYQTENALSTSIFFAPIWTKSIFWYRKCIEEINLNFGAKCRFSEKPHLQQYLSRNSRFGYAIHSLKYILLLSTLLAYFQAHPRFKPMDLNADLISMMWKNKIWFFECIFFFYKCLSHLYGLLLNQCFMLTYTTLFTLYTHLFIIYS